MGLFFVNSIIFSDIGLLKYFSTKKDIQAQREKISKLEVKIGDLETRIAIWGQDKFETEKMARQDLQMGYPNETVYLI